MTDKGQNEGQEIRRGQQDQEQQRRGQQDQAQRRITGLRIMTGAVGAVLFVGGLLQGEYAVTLNKAVHICLECIGIG